MEPHRPVEAAVAAALALAGAAAPSCAAGLDDQRLAAASDWIVKAWQASWIGAGYAYATAPALMAGLVVVALVPPLAFIGHIVNRVTRARNRRSGARNKQDRDALRTVEASARGLGWPLDAWITVENADRETAPERRRLPREVLSIGRADDNALALAHPTVHRHHAMINRSEDTRIIIRDLSGTAGNGVKINGERVEQAALVDGDRIEIGKVVLVFEAKPM